MKVGTIIISCVMVEAKHVQ